MKLEEARRQNLYKLKIWSILLDAWLALIQLTNPVRVFIPADYGVERFRDFLEATEGHPQALAVLVVGEGAGDAVKVEADGGGHVFPERLDVGLVPGAVPQQALVGQAPRSLLLTQHVHKGVHV